MQPAEQLFHKRGCPVVFTLLDNAAITFITSHWNIIKINVDPNSNFACDNNKHANAIYGQRRSGFVI